MIKDMTIQTFLDELASKASTPGGGGGAAVNGAIGAALISMVANFTIGKKGYEYFYKRGYTVTKQYIDFWNELSFNTAINIDIKFI